MRGVIDVGFAAFLVLGAAAVAVCLALWSFYESRHELDRKALHETEQRYKDAHSRLTTCESRSAALVAAAEDYKAAIARQAEAMRNIVRERDEALLRWQAERDAANRARVAAGRRVADLLNLVPPEGFVEQCKALEELRLRYRS